MTGHDRRQDAARRAAKLRIEAQSASARGRGKLRRAIAKLEAIAGGVKHHRP